MKDIVIIANFCRDFSETDNGRFMYLCKELSKENKVEIITSDFNHSAKKHKSPLSHKWPFKITFLHETGYKKNISVQRFVSHYRWGKEVGKYLRKRKKPDVIYCAVPSLTAPLQAAKYCEKNEIKFIIDIQDLWPEAFKMAFHIPIISDIVFAPFSAYVNGVYKRADEICAVSKTYANRAARVNDKCKKAHVAFLGTKLATFDEYAIKNPVVKPQNKLWLGYCGSLGSSYDITIVLDALSILKRRGVNVPTFIVLGDGELKEQFEQHAKDLKIDCIFTGRLPYELMCGWLAACDIAVNPIKAGSAGSIINKHGDYAAAGIPVLNTQESEEYRELVKKTRMGFNCKNEDADRLADKLLLLIENEKLRLQMGKNARRCAEQRFDRANSYQVLLKCILA